MVGYPKHLNTKADYEYVMANFPREQWEDDLRALLESSYGWYPVRELTDKDVGEVIDGEKSVVEIENIDGTITQMQYERRVNQTAKIFRIGFSVVDVEDYLHEEGKSSPPVIPSF